MNRILIVEDDADINSLLNDVLRQNKYEVLSAFSGTEALMCLEHKDYDLILLDLMLPGLCGEELIKKIRKIKKMPIIVVSAKTADYIRTIVCSLEITAVTSALGAYVLEKQDIK